MDFKIGDVWVIKSIKDTLETVKITAIKGDKVIVRAVDDGYAAAKNDLITLSKTVTKWVAFVHNDEVKSKNWIVAIWRKIFG